MSIARRIESRRNMGIEANARDVRKEPIVDFPEIYRSRFCREGIGNRLFRRQRDAELQRETIARTCGNDAHRHLVERKT